jgi:hypothetical protein
MSSTAYISGICRDETKLFKGKINTPDTSSETTDIVKLGAQMSSGHITGLCNTESFHRKYENHTCIPCGITPMKTVQLPSLLLASKVCKPPTPEEFAKFPKVAVPCSVRTEALKEPSCPILPTPRRRFQKYVRYTPPVPCIPLPQTVNMVGKSLGSTRAC